MKTVKQTSCMTFSQRTNLLILCFLLFTCLSCKKKEKPPEEEIPGLSTEAISSAENPMGLFFDEKEKELLADGLGSQLKMYEQMRTYSLNNSVPPAIQFNPIPAGFQFEQVQKEIEWDLAKEISMPENKEGLAFYSVAELSCLIKSQQITSIELTKLYISRLKKYGDTLHCVITLTEELALKQAAKADEEIAGGLYRGPLHGIPYGVKDLLALKGYKTTWGATPFIDQEINKTATIIKKLDEAGAVLLAKLSMGALAMGDIWYNDTTRNPWNLKQGFRVVLPPVLLLQRLPVWSGFQSEQKPSDPSYPLQHGVVLPGFALPMVESAVQELWLSVGPWIKLARFAVQPKIVPRFLKLSEALTGWIKPYMIFLLIINQL